MVASGSKLAFTALVVLVALQRLGELRVSRRHETLLRERGGVEHAPGQMPWMRALHGGWLLAMMAEVWLLDRPFDTVLAVAASFVLASGQALRLIAMSTLGERWTVKIITLHDAPPVTGGIFRWMRHPNYLGVILEIAALPLVHRAFLSAATFSCLNGMLLYFRIRAEEASLASGGRYQAAFARTPRLIPRGVASHEN